LIWLYSLPRTLPPLGDRYNLIPRSNSMSLLSMRKVVLTRLRHRECRIGNIESVTAHATQWSGPPGKPNGERHAQTHVLPFLRHPMGEDVEHVALRLAYQAGHSIVWRDAVNGFYITKCGIPMTQIVSEPPWRIEAEDMELDGYKIVSVSPAEAASGGKAIITI